MNSQQVNQTISASAKGVRFGQVVQQVSTGRKGIVQGSKFMAEMTWNVRMFDNDNSAFFKTSEVEPVN